MVVGALALLLCSCTIATVKTEDLRFKNVLGYTIHTKRSLNLYEIEPQLTGDAEHHLITAGSYPFKVLAVLPSGHLVSFTKLRKTPMSGGAAEYLLGTTEFRGKTYPVCYGLGFSGDESNAGWRMIYRSFTIPGND